MPDTNPIKSASTGVEKMRDFLRAEFLSLDESEVERLADDFTDNLNEVMQWDLKGRPVTAVHVWKSTIGGTSYSVMSTVHWDNGAVSEISLYFHTELGDGAAFWP